MNFNIGQVKKRNIKIYLILPKETLKMVNITFLSKKLCYANNIKSMRS